MHPLTLGHTLGCNKTVKKTNAFLARLSFQVILDAANK